MLKYWMIGSGAALGVLLVAAIAIALMRDAVVLPEGSPERAVQLYLEAVSDDDIEAARAMLSTEFRERCTLEEMFSRSFGSPSPTGWHRLFQQPPWSQQSSCPAVCRNW